MQHKGYKGAQEGSHPRFIKHIKAVLKDRDFQIRQEGSQAPPINTKHQYVFSKLEAPKASGRVSKHRASSQSG